jgi:protein SCO1/2
LAAGLVLAAGLLSAPPAWAHAEGSLGVEERPGAQVPLEARFTDEQGRQVALGELIRGPTILSLMYYRCENACDLLLLGTAEAVRDLGLEPGKDYSLLTVSIDERETPAEARQAQRIALASVQKPFPPEAWRFLTGSAESIRALADAVGVGFQRAGEGFDHPLALIVLSPAGRVTRYLLGSEFLPLDLHMSILEASQGKVGPTVARVLRFCLRYDASNRRYVFNTLKVSALVTLSLAAGLALFLALGGGKPRARGGSKR